MDVIFARYTAFRARESELSDLLLEVQILVGHARIHGNDTTVGEQVMAALVERRDARRLEADSEYQAYLQAAEVA